MNMLNKSFTSLFFLVMSAFLCVQDARSADLYFNINALNLTEEQKEQMDPELLSRTDIQMPGMYEVTLRVNRENTGKHRINFVECNRMLCPELTTRFLRELGVNVSANKELSQFGEDDAISHLETYIPGTIIQFDFYRSVLDLSIPQIAMNRHVRGYIPQERWDDGLPMLFSSYHATGAENRDTELNKSDSSYYLTLRNGINYGSWRLRNNSYYQENNNRREWRSLQTWLEKDIRSLYSRLIVGETHSAGLLFDSINFQGMSISSQDSMLPDGMYTYAPEISGVAATNAAVEIRQDDNLIYQTYVSPGEFIINDMYVPSTSGDLEVTIREEDGSVRIYRQSFASPPISVRKGKLKYFATVGETKSRDYRQGDAVRQFFGQGEFLYGVLNDTSLYSGLIAAENYRSGMLGAGQGLGIIGALSLDTTYSKTHFYGGEKQAGQSWRLRYNKRFDTTGTNITLSGDRSFTDGYYNFSDASDRFYTKNKNDRSALKSRIQLNLSQSMGSLGAVSLSANQRTYWNRGDSRSRGITGSWNKTFGGIAVNLTQSQNKNWYTGRTDNMTSVNISLPVDKWLSGSRNQQLRVNNTFTRSDSGSSTLNNTVSGVLSGEQRLTWSASHARNKQTSGIRSDSISLSGTYQNAFSRMNAGYSDYYGRHRRFNWGVRGAIVTHPYGMTMSQPLSEGSSYALIRAPEARNVSVKNRAGLTTDWRGYAVIPYMMSYRENSIALDTATLGDNVELDDAEQRVIPTREALVLADYNIRLGYRVLLSLKYNGSPVPFGAIVSTKDNHGITNEYGQVYLSGIPDNTEYSVTLPGGKSCGGIFDTVKTGKRNGIIMAEMECT